jgi:phenylalanyl-tRNA synthetase beta chain
MSDVALFETGPVFRARQDAAAPPTLPAGVRPAAGQLAALDASLPDQPQRIAVVLAGARERGGWWGTEREAAWFDAVAAVTGLGRGLGVDVDVRADTHAPFHPGRCARLGVGERLLGHAGELHPRVLEACDLPARTCAAEVSLDVLLEQAPLMVAAPVVSAYPPATLDVAVTVPADVPSGDVADALAAGAGDLLEALRLFDVYVGDQAGEGRKSLAFTMRLRARDRTLTAEEALAVRDAAVGAAADRCGATLRQ